MDFAKDEIELIHTMWLDETQDEDVISAETGIPKDRVLQILQLLSKEGKIKDFTLTENEIISFSEMLIMENKLWLKGS